MRRFLGAIAVVAVLTAACSSSEPQLAGIVRIPAPVVAEVSLPDATNGASYAMQAAPGGVLLVYFGYTSCPDVCPTTLAEVRSALAELGDDAAMVDVAMVTVDPERDTPEILTGYVRSFVPDGIGLRTLDDPELRAAAAAFGAAYDVATAEDGTIEVGHTAHLYAVDDAGILQVTWPFGIQSADIASDIEILMADR